MEKFSNEIVNAYINGENINGYSIDELENNAEFMIKVMEVTNDKNIYNHCSDELKVNEKFVKSVVVMFKDDIDFISNVADKYRYYLDNMDGLDTNVTIRKASFARLMVDLIGNRDEAIRYRTILAFIYSTTRAKIENAKRENKNNNENLGFNYFKKIYGEDEELLSYFAASMVEEILDNSLGDFEDFLHKNYDEYDYIPDKYGFLLDHLDKYDKDLVDYLNNHMEALDKGSEEYLNKIKNNWKKHKLDVERVKYNDALDFIHEIIISNMDAVFCEEALLVHLGYKYGIIDKIAKYAIMDKEFIDLLHQDYNDTYFKSIIEFSSADRDMYNQIDGVIKKVLK